MTRLSQRTAALSLPPAAARRPTIGVVPSANGTTVRALRDALQEVVGIDTMTVALASLPAEIRHDFVPVTPMTWVPLEVVHRAVARIAEVAGRSFDDLMDDGVQRAAEKTLRTAWRMLLRVTADHALLHRAPILYAKWRNIGRLQTKIIGPGKVELLLSQWPGVSERNIRSLKITIETVLRLSGRKQVRIQSQSTLDGAKYVITWQS